MCADTAVCSGCCPEAAIGHLPLSAADLAASRGVLSALAASGTGPPCTLSGRCRATCSQHAAELKFASNLPHVAPVLLQGVYVVIAGGQYTLCDTPAASRSVALPSPPADVCLLLSTMQYIANFRAAGRTPNLLDAQRRYCDVALRPSDKGPSDSWSSASKNTKPGLKGHNTKRSSVSSWVKVNFSACHVASGAARASQCWTDASMPWRLANITMHGMA